jgi:tetratricopeptide (TPR) repeat protein
LQNAQQALVLNESIESGNELNLAMNLAIFANIHHKAGDNTQALDFIQRAVTIFERCAPSDSLALALVLNNMAAIQTGLGLFTEARHQYDRVLEIFRKVLPEGHPKRLAMETNVEINKQTIKNNEENSSV